MVDYIETNKHGSVVIDLPVHFNYVKILTTFCIDLSQKICPNSRRLSFKIVPSFYQ